MKISDAGIALIKEFETCELVAYPDPGTGGAPWTIGWGHTGAVHEGDTCTQEEADAWLMEDIAKAERCADRALHVAVTQGQYDAFVSLIYNIGPGVKHGRDGIIILSSGAPSTFLRKLNAGDDIGAADEIPKWNKSGGRVMAGLTRRRIAERDLFLS